MNCYFRIATTSGDLPNRWLSATYKIPSPDLYPYNGQAAVLSKQDGGIARRGFASVAWFWDRLDEDQYSLLAGLIVTAQATASGLIYLTTDLGPSPDFPKGTWADVSGKPGMLEGRQVPKSSGWVMQNVRLFANNITIINNPAVGV